MKNLLTRIVSAFIYGLVLIISVLAGKLWFLLFFAMVSTFCLVEFYNLTESGDVKINRFWGFTLAGIMYLSISLYLLGYVLQPKFFFFFLPFLYIIFVQELYNRNKRPFHSIAYTILGIVYTLLPFLLFVSLAFMSADRHYDYRPCLGFLFLLWGADTGAFFSGKLLGRHLLMERISPKKTWEGLFGGLITSIGVALILSKFFKGLSLMEWLGMAAIIVTIGSLGDLVESMFKRELDKKDSGTIMPGHGGVLDRFDGLLISAPFVFLYLLLIQKSV